jgi:hypothetical protein
VVDWNRIKLAQEGNIKEKAGGWMEINPTIVI